MANIIIKRDKVLRALRTEKLNAGFFFGTERAWEKDQAAMDKNESNQPYGEGPTIKKGSTVNPLNCKVCAVGGVLRAHLTKVQLQKLGADALGDLAEEVCNGDYASSEDSQKVKWMLESKNYLGALSVHFENEMNKRKLVTKYFRNELCKFVKKNFPKQFKVEASSLTLK